MSRQRIFDERHLFLYSYHEVAYLRGYRSKPLLKFIQDSVSEMNVSSNEGQVLVMNIMNGFYGVPFVLGLGFGQNLEHAYHDYLSAILPKEG